jgi:hypothetical protein
VTSIERTAYPQFKRLTSARVLHVFFTPTEDEVGVLGDTAYWLEGVAPAKAADSAGEAAAQDIDTLGDPAAAAGGVRAADRHLPHGAGQCSAWPAAPGSRQRTGAVPEAAPD